MSVLPYYMARRRLTASLAEGGPGELFDSGEDGVWLDPSDLSTVWQDVAATTPAGVDDLVARIDDKSGNGHYFHQETSAARPVLRQAGGKYYLEFDGSNDFMEHNPTGANDVTWANDTITDAVVCSGYKERTRQNMFLFGLGISLVASTRWLAQAPDGSGNVNFDCGGVSSPNRISAAWPLAAGNDLVASFVCSVADSEQLVRVNGTQVVGDASGHSVTVNRQAVFGRGWAGLSYQYAAVDLYGFIAVVTRNLTGQELGDLEAYMAGQSGVTL